MVFLSSLFGVDDAKKAAERAATANRAESTAAYGDATRLQQPFIDQGMAGYGKLGDFLGLNGQGAQQGAYDSYQESPDAVYRTGQGIRALDNSFAARTGGTLSGGAIRAIDKYGVDQATQNLNTYLGQLGTVAGAGQNAANTLTGARYNSAGLTTNANTNQGNAEANASLAGGSILGSLINGGMKVAGYWNPFGFGK